VNGSGKRSSLEQYTNNEVNFFIESRILYLLEVPVLLVAVAVVVVAVVVGNTVAAATDSAHQYHPVIANWCRCYK